MNILDPRFKYTPPLKTDVAETWKKHGFKPTTEAERKARQKRAVEPESCASSSVVQFDSPRRVKGPVAKLLPK